MQPLSRWIARIKSARSRTPAPGAISPSHACQAVLAKPYLPSLTCDDATFPASARSSTPSTTPSGAGKGCSRPDLGLAVYPSAAAPSRRGFRGAFPPQPVDISASCPSASYRRPRESLMNGSHTDSQKTGGGAAPPGPRESDAGAQMSATKPREAERKPQKAGAPRKGRP